MALVSRRAFKGKRMKRQDYFLLGFVVGTLAMSMLFFFILHFGNKA
jgi:hypothetical protein